MVKAAISIHSSVIRRSIIDPKYWKQEVGQGVESDPLNGLKHDSSMILSRYQGHCQWSIRIWNLWAWFSSNVQHKAALITPLGKQDNAVCPLVTTAPKDHLHDATEIKHTNIEYKRRKL